MYNRVVGGEIFIIGDLHFSDVFTGKHKDYLTECMWVLRQITDKINDRKPSGVVLLGDIIGWSETNIKNREVFSMFCKILKEWNAVCPVYAVRGNHDLKGYPDFRFLEEFGLIITGASCDGYFDYFGYEGQEVPEIRFHIVDYKDERRTLNILNGTSNVVLGHDNYTIEGVTTWYADHDGVELGMLQSFSDVDMVISGHIHNPSPDIFATQMVSGKSCMLFYPGCPTRIIKDRCLYESCWIVSIKYDKTRNETDINPEIFELQPLQDVFYEDESFINEKTEEEVQEALRKDALKDILSEIVTYRMNTGDPIEQVMRIPNASDEAKEVAVGYLQTVFNMKG